MTLEEEYEKKYMEGFPTFNKLFQLKKDDFIKIMKDIFQDNELIIEILELNPTIIKTLKNDEPEKIEIHYFSSIEITYMGVSYKPEYGHPSYILKFDKFFNINTALNEL